VWLLQVERQAFLGAVCPDEVARQSLHALVVDAGKVSAVGSLHLDDACAVIRHQPRAVGRGGSLLQRYDQDVVEWSRHARVASAVIVTRPFTSFAQSLTMPFASGGVPLSRASVPSNSGDTARNANAAIC